MTHEANREILQWNEPERFVDYRGDVLLLVVENWKWIAILTDLQVVTFPSDVSTNNALKRVFDNKLTNLGHGAFVALPIKRD